MINLIDVYSVPDQLAAQFLYNLLKDRPEGVSISHRAMPTFDEHCAFMFSHPYEAWYLVENEAGYVGAVYLSRQNEIGIHIRPEYQGYGVGPAAVQALMMRHGDRDYLANINPKNRRSIAMFYRLGFTHIQNTYRRDAHG